MSAKRKYDDFQTHVFKFNMCHLINIFKWVPPAPDPWDGCSQNKMLAALFSQSLGQDCEQRGFLILLISWSQIQCPSLWRLVIWCDVFRSVAFSCFSIIGIYIHDLWTMLEDGYAMSCIKHFNCPSIHPFLYLYHFDP